MVLQRLQTMTISILSVNIITLLKDNYICSIVSYLVASYLRKALAAFSD